VKAITLPRCALLTIAALTVVGSPSPASADESVGGAAGAGAPLKAPEFESPIRDKASRFAACCRGCGWSRDGTELGVCEIAGFAEGPLVCELISGGRRTHLDDNFAGRKDFKPNARTRAMEQRMKERGYSETRVGAWAYADDLVITWRNVQHTESGGAVIGAELQVGAKLRGTDDAAYSLTVPGDRLSITVHPDAVGFSADGRTLGVVAHGYGGEYTDYYNLGTVESAKVAEAAYNLAGLRRLKRGEVAAAAMLFGKAAAADPSSEKAAYNRACALARLGAPEAQAALERAIAVGGAPVKTKAARDPDFATVRAAPWFVELTK
jgi:hypothetical protein